jgi:hypothetical protein
MQQARKEVRMMKKAAGKPWVICRIETTSQTVGRGRNPMGFKPRNRTTSREIAGSLSLRERVRVRGDPSKLAI